MAEQSRERFSTPPRVGDEARVTGVTGVTNGKQVVARAGRSE